MAARSAGPAAPPALPEAVDVPAVVAEVRRRRAGHCTVTLFDLPGLRAALVVMRVGTVVPAHRAEGATVIHVVDGRLALSAGGRDVTLGPGQLTALDARVGHGLVAVEDCAFVLTVAGEAQHPAESQPRTRPG